MQKNKLLLLELNEVNFEFLDAYIAQGKLPNFQRFFRSHGYFETISEQSYEELEPWIQWVTAHTGLSFKEHGVFRLGDIVNRDIPQIWERLEQMGFKVGAISPMNANCRAVNPAFFIPDPWTPTSIVAPRLQKAMYASIVQAVGDNASSRVTMSSAANLAIGGITSARFKNYRKYISYLASAKSKPWRRAMFLDLLLGDLFIDNVARTGVDFASLFLNSAAHIQHHYMFSSRAYTGSLRNPDWYVRQGYDPILDVYELYDHMLGDIISRFPMARIVVATALHQDPHPHLTYYWRLKDHAMFLSKLGIQFASVRPLMSRDFMINFDDERQAAIGARRLKAAKSVQNKPLFEVDNRGRDLFVMLTYPDDIPDDMVFMLGNERFENFRADVAFVAIKNGQHDGIGYVADNGLDRTTGQRSKMRLSDLADYLVSALAA